jgi:hypothetical protein
MVELEIAQFHGRNWELFEISLSLCARISSSASMET